MEDKATYQVDAVKDRPQPQPVVVNINTSKPNIKQPKPPKVLTPEQRFAKRYRRLLRYYQRMRIFNFFFHPPLITTVFVPDYVAYTLVEMQNLVMDFRAEKTQWDTSQEERENKI